MFDKIRNLFSRKKEDVEKIHLNVVDEFSDSPGPRYNFEGAFSGDIFRNKYLHPKLNKAMWENKVLVVNLDGAYGYSCAFLEEAFGGLIREHGESIIEINKHLEIASEEEPGLVEEIQNYLKKASETCLNGGKKEKI